MHEQAKKDLLAILVVAIVALVLMTTLDIAERVGEWVRVNEQWELDEVPFVFLILAIAFAAFARRRWQELEREVAQRQLAEAKTLAVQNRYRVLFERASDGIFLLGLEGEEAGRVVDANEAAARMHECAPETMPGKPWIAARMRT